MEKPTFAVTIETASKTYERPRTRVRLLARVVTALTVDGGETLRMRGVRESSSHTVHDFSWPTAQAEHLASFYHQFKSRQSAGVYDCMSVLNYLMGWQDTPLAASETDINQYYMPGAPHSSDRLRPYRPYFIPDRAGKVDHALLGLPDRAHSLSVLGPRGDLVIAQNQELLAFSGGLHIYGIAAVRYPEEIAPDLYQQDDK